MGNLITLNSNNIIALAALIGFIWGLRWMSNKNIEGVLVHAVTGWTFICLAIFIRVGWWSVALITRPRDCTGLLFTEECAYNQWMLEYKYVPSAIAAILFTVMVFTFIRGLEGFTIEEKVAWVFSVIFMATGLTVLSI